MYACKNCGGALRFDTTRQMLLCDNCDSSFLPTDFDIEQDAEEGRDSYAVTVFRCPHCGGEIISNDETAAGFCTFCGSSVILESRIEKKTRPSFIIPFKKSKTDTVEEYKKLLRKSLFAPEELSDTRYLERFRGIYMPYWVYCVEQGRPDGSPANVTASGTTSHREGNYIVTDHFRLSADIKADYRGMSYDASSSFDDDMSGAIAPFDSKMLLRFHPAYFCGFYADLADVPPELYEEEAMEIADEETASEFRRQSAFIGKKTHFMAESLHRENITRVSRKDQAMFPVWFLTYRKKDRVAYAVVNGVTGKAAADLPVDLAKYFIGSLLFTLPLFALFQLFFAMKAATLILASMILLLVSGIITAYEDYRIGRKEKHLDDKGFLYKRNRERAEKTGRKKKNEFHINVDKAGSGNGWLVLVMVLLALGPLLCSLLEAIVSGGLMCLVFIAASVVVCLCEFKCRYDKKNRIEAVGILIQTILAVLSGLVYLAHPVSDLWYYGFSCLCMIFVLMQISGIIRKYNVLVTHPLPVFASLEERQKERIEENAAYEEPKSVRRKHRFQTTFAILLALLVLGLPVLLQFTTEPVNQLDSSKSAITRTVPEEMNDKLCYMNQESGYGVYMDDAAGFSMPWKGFRSMALFSLPV